MLRRDELLALKLVLRCMNVRVGRGVRSTKVDRTKLKEDRDGKTTKERRRRREGRGLDEEGEGGEISGRERQLWEHHKAPGSFSSLSLSLFFSPRLPFALFHFVFNSSQFYCQEATAATEKPPRGPLAVSPLRLSTPSILDEPRSIARWNFGVHRVIPLAEDYGNWRLELTETVSVGRRTGESSSLDQTNGLEIWLEKSAFVVIHSVHWTVVEKEDNIFFNKEKLN